MPSNAGYEVEPAAIINMIRENLTDRYRDPYAVMKELVQNSDDAKSSRMEIGWSDGLGDAADHPLLRGPGVFVVNDGAFDESNARAIRRIYLSSKADRLDSIGQFGLGMKSVFHLCEAFFYVWHSESGSQEYDGAEVLNPWGNLCHAEWNSFSEADRARLCQRLAPLLRAKRGSAETGRRDWFALWLPLRCQTHSKAPGDMIFEHNFSGGPQATRLFDPEVLRDLPTLLPLLRYLESIRVWRDLGGQFQEVFLASLGTPACRCAYRPTMTLGETRLGGTIQIRGGESGDSANRTFAGSETLVKDDELLNLRAQSDWPTVRTTDEHGLPIAVRRKAEPHGAVCIVTSPRPVPSGRPLRLRVRRAVFLPLEAEYDEVIPEGSESQADYTLTLHGWFFVDSGRRRIDLPPAQLVSTAESSIRHKWNRRVLESITLPLLIPALQQLATMVGTSHPDIAGVTAAIGASQLFRNYRRAVCAREGWVMAFSTRRTCWKSLPSADPLYVLPGGATDHERAWHTFSALRTLSERHTVTFSDVPRLCLTDDVAAWSVEDVIEMLAVDIESVFSDADSLGYLASFVAILDRAVVLDERVQTRIKALIRIAVSRLGVRHFLDRKQQSLLQALTKLVEQVQHSGVVAITPAADLKDATEQAVNELARSPSGALVLTAEFTPRPERLKPLESASAVSLLKWIGEVQENSNDTARRRASPLTRALAWIARTVLVQQFKKSPQNAIAPAVADIALFPGIDYGSTNLHHLFSIAELQERHGEGILFSGVAKHAALLQRSLPRLRIALVDPSGSRVVDEELQSCILNGSSIPACRVDACVSLLHSGPELSPDASTRYELFTSLVKDGADLNDPVVTRTLRYLIHGQREVLLEESRGSVAHTSLLVDDEDSGSAWHILFEAVTAGPSDRWRRVPQDVARRVSDEQLQQLGIRRVNRDSVIGLLASMDPAELGSITVKAEEARRELLRTWPEGHAGLLRLLAIHRRAGDKELVPIREHTFLRGGFQVPKEMSRELPVVLLDPTPEYAYWADMGSPLAEVFGVEQALREVLALEHPERFWSFILHAVGLLSGKWTEETGQQLGTVSWLPTVVNGVPTAPNSVLRIPEVDEQIATIVGPKAAWTPWLHLPDEVRCCPEHRDLVDLCRPPAEAAQSLMEWLGRIDAYRIGCVDLSDPETFAVWSESLRGEVVAMPIMAILDGLIRQIGDTGTRALVCERLASGLPETGHLLRVLDALKTHCIGSAADRRTRVIALHNQYLLLLAQHADGGSSLRRRELLNQQGKWVSSEALCWDSPGVSRASLVDPEQEAIVRRCLRPLHVCDEPGQEDITTASGSSGIGLPKGNAALEASFAESVRLLERYFEPWGRRVSPAAIGGLFSFMGNHRQMLDLAARYVRPRSVAEVRRSVAWTLPTVLFSDGRKGTRPEKDGVDGKMERHRFVVEVVTTRSTVVPNLFGDNIEVSLSQDFDHIVLHHRTCWVGGAGGLAVTWLQLRAISADVLQDPTRTRQLLGNTIGWMLSTLFEQRPTEDDMIAVVDPDRDLGVLNIRIVQNILLDALPVYLQQISYRGTGNVKSLLDQWNHSIYAKAEAELESEKPIARRTEARESLARSENQLRRLRESMRQVLLTDKVLQSEILTSVCAKMLVARYSKDSVPFEILQNADDAVSEWSEMRGADAPLSIAHRHLVVLATQGSVTFIHWGRPINRARLGSFDGTRRRYQDDLLKMLTIAGSDKSGEESREITTGRFGYGFKSAFLLSAEPQIVSGKLGVQVVAGFYPHELSDGDYRELAELAERWRDASLEGDEATIIHLPLNDDSTELGKNGLSRFSHLLPVVAIFARQISRVTLKGQDGVERVAAWEPEALVGLRRVRCGAASIPLASAGNSTAPETRSALCLVIEAGPEADPEHCQLLLAVGSRGVVALSDSVPAIWVTGPTQEYLKVGFAVNGQFDLHIARDSLAPESSPNERLVEAAGERAGEVLVALFDKSDVEWDRFREQLRLSEETQRYGFWLSIWRRLGEPVAAASRGSPASRLIRALLWGRAGAMRRLVRDRAALPTGLPDTDPLDQAASHERLVRFDEPRHVLKGRLAEIEVFVTVAYWPGFRRLCPPGSLIHPDVMKTLSQLLEAGSLQLGEVGLVDAINSELDSSRCAPPTTAARIGELVTSEFVHALRAEYKGSARDEHDDIVDLLQDIKFRGADRGWHPASTLVVGHDGSDGGLEDRRRASFAPASHVLEPAYEGNALRFFYACRHRQPVKLQTVASWMVRDALTEEQRKSVLAYLAASPDADRVSQHVQDCGHSWLSELSRTNPLFEGMDQRGVAFVLQRAGAHEWNQFVRGEYQQAPPLGNESEEDLPLDAIQRVAAWWARKGRTHLPRYYDALFPGGNRPELFVPEVYDDPLILESPDPTRRRGWMMLFMLGAMQTLGRSRPEQHRGFVNKCLSRGWLDTFSTPPHHDAEGWIRLLSEYFEPQLDEQEYLQWMSLYPRIYQFSHWLHQYVWWLKILDHEKELHVGALMAPRVSVVAEGTEIDAPPLTRALGSGIGFLIRELVRDGFLRRHQEWSRYCFAASRSVRLLVRRMHLCELSEEVESVSERLGQSEIIHRHLQSVLADPGFGGAYDIPLRLLADDEVLLAEAMREVPLPE